MRKLIVYILFFISYSPLFLYLWIVNLKFPRNLLELGDVWLLLCVSFLLAFVLILSSIHKTAPNTVTVEEFEEKNIEFLSYTITYFFAFLGLRTGSMQEVLGTCLLSLFIAFVYSRSNLIYSNPVLLLFGYSIYQAKTSSGKQIMILSKHKNLRGKNIPLIQLSDRIYLSSLDR